MNTFKAWLLATVIVAIVVLPLLAAALGFWIYIQIPPWPRLDGRHS